MKSTAPAPQPEPFEASPFSKPAPPSQAPAAVEEEPFGGEPFGGVAVAEPEVATGENLAEIQGLLAGARQVVTALEAALESAREHERALAEKLERA